MSFLMDKSVAMSLQQNNSKYDTGCEPTTASAPIERGLAELRSAIERVGERCAGLEKRLGSVLVPVDTVSADKDCRPIRPSGSPLTDELSSLLDRVDRIDRNLSGVFSRIEL